MQGNTNVQAKRDGDRVVAHHHPTVAHGLKVKSNIKAGRLGPDDRWDLNKK